MITITKEPTGIYPVFNDSYLEFTSDLINNYKCEISIPLIMENIFKSNKFIIYPNHNGKYIFNLKYIVKGFLTVDGFNDMFSETPTNFNLNGFGESINQGYRRQQFNIKVYNDDTYDSKTVTYEFFKSVKQIGEPIFNNTYQILNHSLNGFDFNLTYFEGFPFTIDLQRIETGTEINIKNLNNGIISQFLESSSTNVYRLYLDTGIDNWTTTEFLPLTDTINRFEIYGTTVFGESNNRVNLNLKKVPSKCGIYLKWFNHNGGYSYYLFDEFYDNTLTTKDLSSIRINKFLNINDGLVSPSTLIGKSGVKKMKVTTLVDKNEAKIIESLFTSPSIQMWSSQIPFNNGYWTNINISNSYKINTKKDINKVGLIIELPELLTPTL